eukprot:augustus_masked-scaffold_34-processed-gene-3.3-mRNA-1 protein AED:0.06 eAED:0.11 QI:0/-1/0/1/-1/1/1/0/347
MPENGIKLKKDDDLLTSEEILRVTKLMVGKLGINKIRLTGGEPTVSKDFYKIVKELGNIKRPVERRDGAWLGSFGEEKRQRLSHGYSSAAYPNYLKDLCVTTNGVKLGQRLNKLEELVASGVNRFNLSLDSLSSKKFSFITRRPENHFAPVLKCLSHLTELKRKPEYSDITLKLNVVVQKGFNEDELSDFVNLTVENPIQVRFIEFMPFSDNKWQNKRMMSKREMLQTIFQTYNLEPFSTKKATAEIWKVPGHVGDIGFISSMSDHFCSTCSRLRLLHDGSFKTCLFSPKSEELDLKTLLRGNATQSEIEAAIREELYKKKFSLGGHKDAKEIQMSQRNRPMTTIGG